MENVCGWYSWNLQDEGGPAAQKFTAGVFPEQYVLILVELMHEVLFVAVFYVRI